MPKQSGIKLYQQIKSEEDLQGIPIIIITGLSQYRQFYAQDFADFPVPEEPLEKPPDPNKLLARVNDLLR